MSRASSPSGRPAPPGTLRVLLLSAEYPPLEGGVGDYTQRLAEALLELGADRAEPIEVAVLTGREGAQSQAARGSSPALNLQSRLKPAEPTAPASSQPRRGFVSSAQGFSPARSCSAPALVPVGANISGEGGVPTIRCIGTWAWRSLPQTRDIVRRLRPDVLHIQYQTAAYGMHPAINLLPLWLRATLPEAERPRLVTTFHDLRPPYLFPKAGPVRALVAPLLAAVCDAFVVTSPEAVGGRAGRLLRRIAPHALARSRAIPIGSNVAASPNLELTPEVVRARLRLRPGTPLIGHFGLVNRTKGLDDLLHALARLIRGGLDAHLVIVGGTPGASDPTNRAWHAAMLDLTRQLGLAARVHWTGFLAPADAAAYLAALDALALPYRDGATFGRGTLMAALALGIPTVTTQPPRARLLPAGLAHLWRNWPALRDGEHALLVPAASPESLADALARLLAAPSLGQHLGENARTLARFFAWDAIAARTLDLYRSLLGPGEVMA